MNMSQIEVGNFTIKVNELDDNNIQVEIINCEQSVVNLTVSEKTGVVLCPRIKCTTQE